VLVDLFAEILTNNLEKPAMPFRMSRELKFWVEVECDQQEISQTDDKQIARILREFEQCGEAMRSLNRRGQVVWKPTKQMLEKLADAEAEAEAEENEL
jgi:hypothetical protein